MEEGPQSAAAGRPHCLLQEEKIDIRPQYARYILEVRREGSMAGCNVRPGSIRLLGVDSK